MIYVFFILIIESFTIICSSRMRRVSLAKSRVRGEKKILSIDGTPFKALTMVEGVKISSLCNFVKLFKSTKIVITEFFWL